MHATRRLVGCGHVFPVHAHAGWSVATVQAGAADLRASRGSHVAGAGAVTVLHPGEAHRSRTHRTDGLDYVVVDLDEDTATKLHGRQGVPTFASCVIDDPQCAAGLREAYRLQHAGARAPAENAFAAVLAQLFTRHAGRSAASAEGTSNTVRTVCDHLDRHSSELVTLVELAELAQVSVATLMRRFQDEIGMTPHRYLLSRRIDRAKDMLGRGTPIVEVAARTGFADQSHLHRQFTRCVGVTPGRFRAGH
ncbi:AraC family transcriptional regulator [Pseudonocardia sp. CA-107938]|uniref:helix-turn-helix transcriptional regulator n=1 Tax=Pseudonocardia sp. CA-107938 TaxID=3240021 RepID=UPI003D8F4285